MGRLREMKIDPKQRKRIIAWVAAAAVVLLLAVLPMLASGSGADSGTQASILAASVEYQTVDTEIIGGGQLASEASIRIKIPEEVKLTEYLVGNGDTVSEGDPIATVDKVSVMTAITGVQETLDYLADEIADASDETASDTVKALAGGTVKIVYAKKGESVEDVMLDHGALAVLSLDDTMAVQVEADSDLKPGDTVSVSVSGSTSVDGRVKSNQSGLLTITFDDDDYDVGAQVTVRTEDGQRLGTGELYIYSPWNATAYSGTVSSILVDEGDSVYVGQTIMNLEDPGNSAEYQRLIDQRHDYEELMQELFTMYRTETITAPCDGIITGVDKDGAFLLSDTGESWVAKLLSFFTGDTEEGFVAYTAKVSSVSDGEMELLVDPDEISVSDLTTLSGISADVSGMTESWRYSGDQTVYIQTSEGLLQAAGTAKAGDVLLAVGDQDNVYWFVRLSGGSSDSAVQTTVSTGGRLTAQLLSDDGDEDDSGEAGSGEAGNGGAGGGGTAGGEADGGESGDGGSGDGGSGDGESGSGEAGSGDTGSGGSESNGTDGESGSNGTGNGGEDPGQTDVCTGSDGCSASVHNDGCPMKIMLLSDDGPEDDEGSDQPCTGEANCPAQTHDPGCKSLCDGTENCPAQNHKDGCLSQQTDPPAANTVSIITTALNAGVVGQSYSSPLQASDGQNVLSGTWAASGLPGGLTINEESGTISGTPTAAGSYPVTVRFTYNDTPVTKEFTLTITEAAAQTVYRGYVAQVMEVVDGAVKVKQTAYSYTITDLNRLPTVSADTSAMTAPKTYTDGSIRSSSIAAGDIVLIVIDEDGALVQITKANTSPGAGDTPGMGTGGMPSGGMPSGSMSSGGMSAGMSGMGGGMGQVQTFQLYSLDELTIASVTSQEHMTLDVTVDELDISKIYVGQSATITMDALAGETFSATVSEISNSGTNDGGNSKFTVELTLEKSGEMLPGMTASAFIQLGTEENVLCVPASALGEENGETVLYTSYDKESATLGDPVTVTIGTADAEYVQILDGLSEGDTVYYAYYDTLPSATPF